MGLKINGRLLLDVVYDLKIHNGLLTFHREGKLYTFEYSPLCHNELAGNRLVDCSKLRLLSVTQ